MMASYNELLKRGGILPISKYRVFYKKLETYLKSTNRHVLFSKHKAACANCGLRLVKEDLINLKTEGPKKGMERGKVYGLSAARVEKLRAGKCPRCGNSRIKITMIKASSSSLNGTYSSVYIFGETLGLSRQYKNIENKFVNWILDTQKNALSPAVKNYRIRFGKLPASNDRRGIDSMVKKKINKTDYHVESYRKDGVHFLVVYVK